MKRFFCTVCKSLKRVQQFPSNISEAYALAPQDRIGQCDWHTTGRINGKPVSAWKPSDEVQEETRMVRKPVDRKAARKMGAR